jgi:hypothetical protein
MVLAITEDSELHLLKDVGAETVQVRKWSDVEVDDACFMGNTLVACTVANTNGISIRDIAGFDMQHIGEYDIAQVLVFCRNTDNSQPPKIFATNRDGFLEEWSPWYRKPKEITSKLTGKMVLAGFNEYEVA